MFNLIASVIIPQGSGLRVLIYGLLRGVYNMVGNYGVAIILFTLFLRLIILPLDFLNKYFTKRNATKMAVFKNEDAELKKQYGTEPMKYMTARREMYRRNGYNPLLSSVFMMANMIITMIIFITVFGCLRTISAESLNNQYQELSKTYIQYDISNDIMDGEEFSESFITSINTTYEENNSSFLWVHNIFRSDTSTSKTPSLSEFSNATKDIVAEHLGEASTTEQREAYTKQMHETIITNLSSKNSSGWNGWFLLVILSGVTMYFSTQVNMAAMKKKKIAEATKEVEVSYSMRKTKEQSEQTMPTIDPAAMMKYMKWIMPIMIVFFTFSSNAAFALYITMGAIVQTSLGLGVNLIIDKIIAKQEQKKKDAEPNHPVINPHTRYFKKKKENAT